MITGGCVTLETADPARLAAFYESLGLERSLEKGDWIELKAPDGFRLALHHSTEPGAPSPRASVGFGTSVGLDEAVRLLTAGGTESVREEDPAAGVALLRFRDPDGNALYVWESA